MCVKFVELVDICVRIALALHSLDTCHIHAQASRVEPERCEAFATRCKAWCKQKVQVYSQCLMSALSDCECACVCV